MTNHPGSQSLARLLLIAGAIGPPLFIVAFSIEGALRPDYSALRYPVSSLSIGAGGWAQQANFIVTGLLIAALAAGLRLSLRPTPGSTWGPIFIAVVGLGLIGAGVFSTDPVFGYPPGHPLLIGQVTTHGHLHDLFSTFVFLGLPVACFIFTRRFRRLGEGRWAIYSLATGAGMPLLFIVSAVGFAQSPGWVDVAGLLQRLTIGVGWMWMMLLAVHVLRRGSRTSSLDE